ncbi:MAG: NAD(P)-dependent glycerol-3-phosphate dehydrogenase, partial [Bifidobacteriaceae bacterium]|nr:NAD(P)-dependent glycerol-3-phosphate dehydrogenase [Bifidobacteriaceae bacterium]
MTNLAVIGSGAFGTTFALIAADAGAHVRILARDRRLASAVNRRHRNDKYLPGIVLPSTITAGTDPAEVLQEAEIVLVAVAAQAADPLLKRIADAVPGQAVVVSLMKGVELGSGRRMSEVISQVLERSAEQVACVSGPNLARQLAQRQPAGTVVASANLATAERVAAALSTDYLRTYTSSDLVGVELCGAVKNVIAFACGVASGLGFGANTVTTLMTRGLAELTRLGLAYGANLETFSGLAGVGDLAVTCLSPVSRNHRAGLALGQ